MSVDLKEAVALLRRRSGGERSSTSPFVVAARDRLEHAVSGTDPTDDPLREIVATMQDRAAELAGLAAVLDQHPQRRALPLGAAMRLPTELEQIVSTAALAYDRAARLADLVQCTSALEGRSA